MIVKPPKYDAVRHTIKDGDNALFRNGGPIARTQDTPWTHAAKCKWVDDVLMLAEVREFIGGRLIPLRGQVRAYPGRIDIFRPKCDPRIARMSARLAVRQSGHPYGWPSVWRALCMRANLIRLLTGWSPDTSDTTLSEWYETKHCAQLCAWCDRFAARALAEQCGSDWDPLPRMGDKWITPGDLGTSDSYQLLWQGLVL